MSKPQFASAKLTMGQINAIVKKLGGYERALRFLGDELVVKEKNDGRWFDRGDVIHTQVITDGTTGEDWYERLNAGGVRVGLDDDAYQILIHPLFIPTSKMVTKVAIFRGSLFKAGARNIKMIRAEAQRRNLVTPDVDLACYLREKFSDDALKDMGLSSIVVMHDPIELYHVKRQYILALGRDGGGNALRAAFAEENGEWYPKVGFAFVVSQTRSGFAEF